MKTWWAKVPGMQRVFETIRMVAGTDLTVLITGPSGTGKDLTARAVHSLSDRKDRPYIAVNCPTIPENILESELFGYKKGAFTHATQDRAGLFQEAHTGTIFLDEIGDVSPTIQTKLLRVLQEKEVKPLGDIQTDKGGRAHHCLYKSTPEGKNQQGRVQGRFLLQAECSSH